MQSVAMRLWSKYRRDALKISDERMHIITEILQGITIISNTNQLSINFMNRIF